MKNYTLKTWLNEWLLVYKKPYIKDITYRYTKAKIYNHIPNNVLKLPLSAIFILDLQKVINSVSNSRTAVDIYNILHSSLKVAYKLDLIQKDIADLLVKPKHVYKLGSALSDKEIIDFKNAIKGHRAESYFLFLLYSGCRRSEALNLTLGDIDFLNNCLYIRGTKTTNSNRILPFNSNLNDLIHNIYPIIFRIDVSKLRLFNFRKDYVTKLFKKFCPNHKLHDLRHTFATKCLECGISMKTVQIWLGHADFETTANIYSHLLPEFSKNESSKLKF